jgi:hypothetical protein
MINIAKVSAVLALSGQFKDTNSHADLKFNVNHQDKEQPT